MSSSSFLDRLHPTKYTMAVSSVHSNNNNLSTTTTTKPVTVAKKDGGYGLGLVEVGQLLRQQTREQQIQQCLAEQQQFDEHANEIDHVMDARRSFEKVSTSIEEFIDFEERRYFTYASQYFEQHPDYWETVQLLIRGQLLLTYPLFNKTIQISLANIQQYANEAFEAKKIKLPPRVVADAHGQRILYCNTPTTPRQLYFFTVFFQSDLYPNLVVFLKQKFLQSYLQ